MVKPPLRKIETVEIHYEKEAIINGWEKAYPKAKFLNLECGHRIEVNPGYLYLPNASFECPHCAITVTQIERIEMNKFFEELACEFP